MGFEWQTLMDSQNPQFLVKGSELAQAIVPHTQARFAIVEARCIESDGFPGVMYRVRDAETVTDAQVREGIRPAIVFRAKTFDEAMEWIQGELFAETLGDGLETQSALWYAERERKSLKR